jgi:RimJ/RimL family protein N-acetyltransferase
MFRLEFDLMSDMTLGGPVPIGQSDASRIIEFLGSQEWPFHGGGSAEEVAAGYFASDVQAFWVIADPAAATLAGLIKLYDLADGTPMFDLRIGTAHRGTGLGSQALRWLTGYLFTELPGIRRIEGTTRQDNIAMRRTFRTCGYVKEAHYRQAWPAPDGTVYDAVGYAILRSDWESGTATPPEWADE